MVGSRLSRMYRVLEGIGLCRAGLLLRHFCFSTALKKLMARTTAWAPGSRRLLRGPSRDVADMSQGAPALYLVGEARGLRRRPRPPPKAATTVSTPRASGTRQQKQMELRDLFMLYYELPERAGGFLHLGPSPFFSEKKWKPDRALLPGQSPPGRPHEAGKSRDSTAEPHRRDSLNSLGAPPGRSHRSTPDL